LNIETENERCLIDNSGEYEVFVDMRGDLAGPLLQWTAKGVFVFVWARVS